VIVNNRIYNDYEDDDYSALRTANILHEPNLEDIPQAYPFSLSRHGKSLPSSESVLSSTSDLSEKEETQEQDPPKKDSESGRTYNILRSQYIGDGVVGRSHAVQLSLMPELIPSSWKSVSPVFKWM